MLKHLLILLVLFSLINVSFAESILADEIKHDNHRMKDKKHHGCKCKKEHKTEHKHKKDHKKCECDKKHDKHEQHKIKK